MPTHPLSRFIQGLRRSLLRREGAGLTDGDLLTRFIDSRDDDAFEALVRRHGPMVLSVCRRVLGSAHDAEPGKTWPVSFRFRKERCRAGWPRPGNAWPIDSLVVAFRFPSAHWQRR